MKIDYGRSNTLGRSQVVLQLPGGSPCYLVLDMAHGGHKIWHIEAFKDSKEQGKLELKGRMVV